MDAIKHLLVIALLAATAASQAQNLNLKGKQNPLTRAELRACMDADDLLNQRSSALDTQMRELEAESAAVAKSAETIAEGLRTIDAQDHPAVDAHNAKAREHDARVTAYNKRSDAYNDSVKAHNNERADWMSRCATRTYLQADKDAILKEKKKAG